jgi:hypothetical protein
MSTKNKSPQILDKRLVDRYVSRGIVKRTEVDKALKALPDLDGTTDDIAELVYGAGESKDAEA